MCAVQWNTNIRFLKKQNQRKIGSGPVRFVFIKEKEDGPGFVCLLIK